MLTHCKGVPLDFRGGEGSDSLVGNGRAGCVVRLFIGDAIDADIWVVGPSTFCFFGAVLGVPRVVELRCLPV